MKDNPEKLTASRPGRNLESAVCVFLSLVVLCYAGLIGLGRWQEDEYAEFYKMRAGAGHLVERLRWSPRPVSEPVYVGYAWAVNHWHHEFVAPFLGLLWLLFLGAGLLTYWQGRRRAESRGRLLLALTIMAVILAGGELTEVFYWPAGAVAYMPTLAATLLLFLQVVDGRLQERSGRMLAGLCLAVSAGCSETGATFVLCYAAILGIREGIQRVKHGQHAGKPFLWYAVPLALALAVLAVIRTNRYNMASEAASNGITGHPLKSLIAGVQQVAIEAIGHKMLAYTYHAHPHPAEWIHAGVRFILGMVAGSRVWMELLLGIGVALYWTQYRKPSRELADRIIELTAALLLGSIFTTAAANLHFGITCCERHEEVRESWMAMTIAGLAIAGGAWMGDERRRALARNARWAPVLLCGAVLSLGFVGPLFRNYRMYAEIDRAYSQNIESGFGRDQEMDFWVVPSGEIVKEESIPTGTYMRPAAIKGFGYDVYADYLLGFFDKQQVTIRPLASEVPSADAATKPVRDGTRP